MSKTAANIKIRTQAETFKMIVTSQISMYVLLGAVVFVAPNLSDSLGGSSIAKTTTALLFVVGACFGLVQSIPILLNANAAADRIARLEAALAATAIPAEPRAVVRAEAFRADRDAQHRVPLRRPNFPTPSFKIGPIDFTLRSGELDLHHRRQRIGQVDVFAGAVRALSARFRRNHARRQCAINDATRDDYRALMSAIFFDYHLFQRLYGVSEADPAEIDRLLAKFRLDRARLSLTNGEFRTLDLSGGQRRRLALDRQHAREAPDHVARRVDGRAGPRISAQIL